MNRRHCIFCALAAAIMPLAARAHEAAAGWLYDGECCSQTDCAPVPSSALVETPEGLLVDLRPGDHFKAPGGLRALIPWDATFNGYVPEANGRNRIVRNVKDGIDPLTHICIYPVGTIRCIYRGARNG